MFKRVLAISLLAIAGLLLADPAAAAERRFVIASFEKIRVVGGIIVELSTDRSPTALATGEDQRTLDRLSLRNNGRTLVVSLKRSTLSSRHAGGADAEAPLVVKLSTYRLAEAELTGGGELSIDRMEDRETRITLIGAGRIAVGEVEADLFDANIRGSGELVVAGSARKTRAELNGAGLFDASGFETRDLELFHYGSATSRLSATGRAEIVNLGAGAVTVTGGPECDVRSVGAGSVRCGEGD